MGHNLWSHDIGGRRKRAKCPKIVFENREGLREGAHGIFNLYRPTPNEVKKAYKPEERSQHGSNSQFNSEMEESMYKDFIPENKNCSNFHNSELSMEAGIGKALNSRI
jgi:hypothetical protein